MSSVDVKNASSKPIVVAPVSAIVGVLGALGFVQINGGSQSTNMVETVTRIETSAESAADDIRELKDDFKTTNSEMLARFDKFLGLFADMKPEVAANTGRSTRNERDIDRLNTRMEQLHQPVQFGGD